MLNKASAKKCTYKHTESVEIYVSGPDRLYFFSSRVLLGSHFSLSESPWTLNAEQPNKRTLQTQPLKTYGGYTLAIGELVSLRSRNCSYPKIVCPVYNELRCFFKIPYHSLFFGGIFVLLWLYWSLEWFQIFIFICHSLQYSWRRVEIIHFSIPNHVSNFISKYKLRVGYLMVCILDLSFLFRNMPMTLFSFFLR